MDRDYSVSEIAALKRGLEDMIRKGLDDLLSQFHNETGLNVVQMSVKFEDVSTLSSIRYVPGVVIVGIMTKERLQFS